MDGNFLLIIRFLLAAALYAFLGGALYVLWRDLRQGSQLVVARRPPELFLSKNGSNKIAFQKAEVLIGRSPAADLTLDDITVSTLHARLSYRKQQWWLEDLDSTNGTFLNEERLVSPLVLASGDQLRLGQVELTVSINEPKPVP